MKKILFLGMSLFFGLSALNAQQVKNKQHNNGNAAQFVEAMTRQDEMDVSLKSSIRFDMHSTTEAQRVQLNMERHNFLVQRNPQHDAQRNAFEASLQQYIEANRERLESSEMVITCPVVFHCVYGSTAQNVSLNQVLSQLQVMNEDFARTNADANSHWSQAVNTTVQFCLAQRTPAGLATTGLESRQYGSSSTSWSTNDNVKSFANGGLDAWDPSRYFNIWVCNLTGGLLGYGEFPTNSLSNTFGAVVDYTCFGSNYTSYGTFSGIQAPFDRGRTVTHEFSHCVDLYHVWGDDGGSCLGSDYCTDTPNQGDATSGCYSWPHVDNCTTTGNGIMYENYLDYSDDNCLNLFTNNQKTRMLAVLNSAPYNTLQTSNGCTSPNPSSNDAAISAITTPNGTVCGTTFTPVVVLKNWGTSTLTTCTIKYQVDATTLQTYTWTGSLATGLTTNVTLSSMTTTSGAHTFTAYTQNPNGLTDANAANDSFTSNFTCTGAAQSIPFFQGFEGTTFVPAGWSASNPDAGITWDRTTSCAKTGVACARMANWDYAGGNGQVDEITAPPVNISTVASPVLTFQVAYTYWTVPYQFSDTLEVLVSTNCGTTWTTVYKKWGAALQTAAPLSSASVGWVATSADWRLETVSLLPYQSASSLLVKFRSITDYEDNLYLDDINIMNSTGMEQSNFAGVVNLFPNPSSGIFNLNIALESRKDINVKIVNTLGQTVQQFAELNSSGGMFELDLNNQPNGVYFVEVIAGTGKTVQRIMVNR
ncbi:MAG: M43 family zinc metalloprotease [Bacteroidota bacterium]|nr:M43 family zinc metalloprotease [Bacteroidota bacterium]